MVYLFSMVYSHVPVMLAEILEYLAPKTGGKFIDCTLGGAGYTVALGEKVGKKGKVLGIDLDSLAIENAKRLLAEHHLDNVILVQSNFENLSVAVKNNFPAGTLFDGIVFDLGLSSAQLDDETRGFSFKGDRPLDMAFGPDQKQSSVQIINNYSLLELTDIFRLYGEEKRAYQIAKAVVNARRQKRIATTADLVSIIESVIPFRFRSRIHPATKIFQALRMETNRELDVLSAVLPIASELLKPGGRIVVVSFHSGEDRIVKRFFKDNSQLGTGKLKILTKRPLVPGEKEIENNPRARSAKLRAAEKI